MQALNNAADGSLRLARRVKINEKTGKTGLSRSSTLGKTVHIEINSNRC